MLTPADFIIILLLGTVGGFISGLLGVGGGLIFIPILEYYLSQSGVADSELVKFTLANSFFVIVFAGAIISYRQWKIGNFYGRSVIYTAITGIISSQLMTYVIIHGTWYNQHLFKIIFLSMVIPMALRMFVKRKHIELDKPMPAAPPLATTGFFTGIVTALSGLGGGIVMVPVFTELLKIPIRKATSISTGVIPLLTLPLVLSYMNASPLYHPDNLMAGYIIFPLVVPLIVSVLLVAPLGVHAAQKVKPSVIKSIFIVVVTIVVIKELYHDESIKSYINQLLRW
jgi:uncharacterized membrane protein YfcA